MLHQVRIIIVGLVKLICLKILLQRIPIAVIH